MKKYLNSILLSVISILLAINVFIQVSLNKSSSYVDNNVYYVNGVFYKTFITNINYENNIYHFTRINVKKDNGNDTFKIIKDNMISSNDSITGYLTDFKLKDFDNEDKIEEIYNYSDNDTKDVEDSKNKS